MLMLGIALVTVAAAIAAWELSRASGARSERLQHYAGRAAATAANGDPEEPQGGVAASLARRAWQRLVRGMKRSPGASGTRQFLVQAAIPLRPEEFAGVRAVVALVAGLITLAATGFGIGPGCAAALAGYVIPFIWLRGAARRRTRAFDAQLTDTLFLISNSLRTGYSFVQAVEVASRESKEPVRTEFHRVLQENRLGMSTEDALLNMQQRVRSEDMESVIAAFSLQRQTGCNLAHVLDTIAKTMLARRKLQEEVRMLTAQGRLSGLILSLMPIVVGALLYVINPGYMRTLFTEPIGRGMLCIAMVLQFVGVLVIRKIVSFKV